MRRQEKEVRLREFFSSSYNLITALPSWHTFQYYEDVNSFLDDVIFARYKDILVDPERYLFTLDSWLLSRRDSLERAYQALVLKDYDHAIARGAIILAEVVGYGFSSNGGGISEPSDNGSVIAMSRAIKDAGVELDDIDYINAHATSTLQGDMYEAIALDRLFHGQRALISSTKSMTGHE